MANKIFKFTGKLFWCKVYEGYHDEYNGKQFYKVTMELDDESEALFNQSKLKLKHRDMEWEGDDIKVLTFRRDLDGKTFKDKKGNMVTLGGGAPRVVDANGDVMTEDQLIGNGSLGEILVERYIPKNMPSMVGHRLEAIKVTKLIPYEPAEFNEDEGDEAPVVETKSPEKKTPAKKTSNKALPF